MKKNPNNHSKILHSFLELVLGSEEHSQRRLSLNELEFFLSSTIYINRNELIGKYLRKQQRTINYKPCKISEVPKKYSLKSNFTE